MYRKSFEKLVYLPHPIPIAKIRQTTPSAQRTSQLWAVRDADRNAQVCRCGDSRNHMIRSAFQFACPSPVWGLCVTRALRLAQRTAWHYGSLAETVSDEIVVLHKSQESSIKSDIFLENIPIFSLLRRYSNPHLFFPLFWQLLIHHVLYFHNPLFQLFCSSMFYVCHLSSTNSNTFFFF